MKRLIYISFAIFAVFALSSCEEKLNPNSIFIDEEEKTDTYTAAFDAWLLRNFREPYNVEFRYKWDDSAMDPQYNLTPVSLTKADTIAHLAKYLWFDVYDKQVSPTFLAENGPRFIQLVGSPALNTSQGTEKLGYAEGGIKITILKVNRMEGDNVEQLNEYIFKTMHHEFGHILHQKKNFPEEYKRITPDTYSQEEWQYRSEKEANEMGYVSNYGSSEAHEDFVEMIANYIVKTDKDWNRILDNASKGTVGTQTGKDIILQKWTIAHDWLLEKWEIELDSLRAEVQRRQDALDMDVIMNMYE